MPVHIDNLTPVETLALHKVELSKVRREQIRPGTYPINLIVHLTGSVTVGEDYEQAFSPAVPWKDIALVLLTNMDADDREAFVAYYLEESENGPAEVRPEAISDEVRTLAKLMVRTATRTCRGKTTAHLDVEALQKAVVVETPTKQEALK